MEKTKGKRDGQEVDLPNILRKSSTEYKPYAHYFRSAVASLANGVAAHFSYSIREDNAHDWAERIAIFPVEQS